MGVECFVKAGRFWRWLCIVISKPKLWRILTMNVTIAMPPVSSCAVTNCAYNKTSSCRARAITVGDGNNPGCDTFLGNAAGQTRESNRIAGVGACKVASCKFNDDLECGAESIDVGATDGINIRCMTYVPRP